MPVLVVVSCCPLQLWVLWEQGEYGAGECGAGQMWYRADVVHACGPVWCRRMWCSRCSLTCSYLSCSYHVRPWQLCWQEWLIKCFLERLLDFLMPRIMTLFVIVLWAPGQWHIGSRMHMHTRAYVTRKKAHVHARRNMHALGIVPYFSCRPHCHFWCSAAAADKPQRPQPSHLRATPATAESCSRLVRGRGRAWVQLGLCMCQRRCGPNAHPARAGASTATSANTGQSRRGGGQEHKASAITETARALEGAAAAGQAQQGDMVKTATAKGKPNGTGLSLQVSCLETRWTLSEIGRECWRRIMWMKREREQPTSTTLLIDDDPELEEEATWIRAHSEFERAVRKRWRTDEAAEDVKTGVTWGPPEALGNHMQTHASFDAEKNEENNAEAIHDTEQARASLRRVQELTFNRARLGTWERLPNETQLHLSIQHQYQRRGQQRKQLQSSRQIRRRGLPRTTHLRRRGTFEQG